MSRLQEILAHKRFEVDRLGPAPASSFVPRPLALRRSAPGPLHLICEIKRRSPSAGQLSTALGVGQRARLYEHGGASMVSVLTDAKYFDGAFAHLSEARAATSIPVLCKDFVIDQVQLDWARALGADAVLLIARCLDQEQLARLLGAARTRGLTPLVEVATEAEADQACALGADLIGVNARDLDSLRMDQDRARRIVAGLSPEVTRVHLSGVKSADDVRVLAAAGLDAALIGEALMRRDDPSELLDQLRAAAG